MPTPNPMCWGVDPAGVTSVVWLEGRFIASLATLHPVSLKVDDVKTFVVGTANAWPARKRMTEKERVDKNMTSKTKERLGRLDGGL